MTTNKQRYPLHHGYSMNFNAMGKSSVMVAVLIFSTLMTACESGESPNADGNVTIEEVTEQPSEVAGQEITVRSKIVQKVGDSSFTLDNEGEDVLVVNVSGKPFVFPEDKDVEIQATGEVTTFTLLDIERNYDLKLNPEVYADYESGLALLADSLALAPSPGQVTENPEKYYQTAIAVEGEVEQVLDDTTFTLDEEQLFGADDLLVIGLPVTSALNGEVVTVTGTLRQFVLAEFERDYDLTWDLDLKRKIEAEYSEKPVFVADALYPSAQ